MIDKKAALGAVRREARLQMDDYASDFKEIELKIAVARAMGASTKEIERAIAKGIKDHSDEDLVSNPGRPPKRWMKKCVRSVEESGSAADPGAVCGSLWHHKMSPAKKRAALAKERRGNPCCGEGYQPGFFSNPNRGY